MNKNAIFLKTNRGEAVGRTRELAEEMRQILKEIDGKISLGQLQAKFDPFLPDAELQRVFAHFINEGYVSEVSGAEPGFATVATDSEKHEQDKVEAESKAKKEAEERVRREAEAKATAEAEERARREAQAKVKKEAEERARRETEAKAKKAAEERNRLELEAKAKKEAEQRREAEARERKGAEERARLELEARDRKEAEARKKKEAEARARREEEARAKREAEERLRREAEGEAPEVPEGQKGPTEAVTKSAKPIAPSSEKIVRKPLMWKKPAAYGAIVLLLLGLILIHFVSFDAKLAYLQKSATEQFQQPVKIDSLRFSLLPQPHWRLEGVSIGAQAQIKLPRIRLVPELGSLFSEKMVLTSLDLESPTFSEEGMAWLLFGKPKGVVLQPGRATATGVKLESRHISPSIWDADLEIDTDGALKKLVLVSVDKKAKIQVQGQGEKLQIAFNSANYAIPFASSLVLDEFEASAIADRAGLTVREFKGRYLGGAVNGNARLRWSEAWTLDGDISAKGLDVVQLFPGLIGGGALEARARYTLRSDVAEKLFAAPRIEGNFVVQNGILLGADLNNAAQSNVSGGMTVFSDLAGDFVHDAGGTQLRQLRLTAGAISASGRADVEAEKLRGNFVVDSKPGQAKVKASLTLAGTVKQPQFSR